MPVGCYTIYSNLYSTYVITLLTGQMYVHVCAESCCSTLELVSGLVEQVYNTHFLPLTFVGQC